MRKKLSDMNVGESGVVVKIGDLKELKNRLLELGILNTSVKVVKKAPFNDPIAIKIGNTIIALRNKEAQKIEVELFKER